MDQSEAEQSKKSQQETVRCFVAIALPQEVKERLQAAQDVLRSEQDGSTVLAKVRWVRPEGTHLTLFFLGEIAADKLDAAMTVARTTLEMPRRPFTLRVAGIGAFPSVAAPRVIWAGVTGDLAALRVLQSALAKALADAGYRSKDAQFSPHLTLARVREALRDDERRGIGETLQRRVADATAMLADAPAFSVRGATFFKSTLAAGGAIYEHLADYSFGVTA